MGDVAAWLMQVDRVSRVAVGQLELIHIISDPDYIEVPRTPEYCQRVVVWNNRIVPILDISMLINKTSAFFQHNAVAVALYSSGDSGELNYGGIQLIDMPVLDKVSNQQYVEASELPGNWRHVSISAYRSKDDDIVPILDTQRLFSPDVAQRMD